MPQPLTSSPNATETNLTLARKLGVDLPVLHPFVTKSPGPIWESCRTAIQKFVHPGETFAHGWAIAIMLLAFYAVDTARRRGLLRIAVVVAVAGLLANIGKLLVGRSRPKAFFDATIDAFSGGAIDSFQGWLPLASLGYTGQSVPSGHTATAVVLGFMLWRRWPHAGWAFASLVAMSVLQQLKFGHYYHSDCLWGAALACVVLGVAYHPALAGGWFDRFEGGTSRRQQTRRLPDLVAEPN